MTAKRLCPECRVDAHDHCACECDVCAHRYDHVLLVKLAEAVTFLENIVDDVEWSWSDAPVGVTDVNERRHSLCPMCCEHRDNGHAPNCDIGLARVALAKLAKEG